MVSEFTLNALCSVKSNLKDNAALRMHVYAVDVRMHYKFNCICDQLDNNEKLGYGKRLSNKLLTLNGFMKFENILK